MIRNIMSTLAAAMLAGPLAAAQPMEPATALFERMMEGMKQVRTCSFVLDIHERIRGELRYDQFVVKLNVNPYKVYVYSITPNPGAEALLIKGVNDGKAVVNPNRWLIPTLNLSPYGTILRRNHQYTLWDFGFGYIHKVLEGYRRHYGKDFYSFLKTDEDISWNGKLYHQLVIRNDDFGFVSYTVKPGETLVQIAEKLLVNDYMILEANPGLRHYDDVKPGQEIRVPNSFGRKFVFYIDKESFLPVVQIVYDHKGMYGRVELSSLIVNPAFTGEDFSSDNKEYGF